MEGAHQDQWFAYMAAWLGGTLDAFDFTVFLLVMLPISQEFGLPLTAVPALVRTSFGGISCRLAVNALSRQGPIGNPAGCRCRQATTVHSSRWRPVIRPNPHYMSRLAPWS